MELIYTPALLGPPDKCRVFMAHKVRDVDISGLMVFGTSVIPLHHRWVFDEEIFARQQSLGPDTLNALERHGGFNSESDYLALMGDPFICAAVVAELTKMLDTFTLIRYDRRADRYLSLTLNSKGTPHAQQAQNGRHPQALP